MKGAVTGLALLLTVAACAPSGGQAPAARVSPFTATPAAGLPVPEPLTWTGCGAPFECATLSVPLDYAKPNGTRIGLALARLRARDSAHRIGSLLLDPGGPGGSGVGYVKAIGEGLARTLDGRFDIVGFDPRGAAGSDPIHCYESAQMEQFVGVDPVPDNAAQEQAIVDASRAYSAACARNSALLPHMTATTVATDMEEMRMALGDAKLSYLGLSYGTLLGSTYADLFPGKVRAMALDGDVDPALGTKEFIRGQAEGLEDSFNRFLAACATDKDCSLNHDGQGRQRYEAVIAKVHQGPIAAGSRKLTPGEAIYGVAEGLVAPTRWTRLGNAVADAARGDGRALLQLADDYFQRRPDGTYGNIFDVYNAVICTDRPAPRALPEYEALAKDLATVAPHFGAATVWQALPCATWPVTATGMAGPLHARGAPPILVVSATHDPATPYSWGQALARELESGFLLTRDGDGHVSLGRSPCVLDAVSAYLLSLKLPPVGKTC